MSLEIAPLRPEHLDDAAALVAARYRALRVQVPLLPPRYEQGEAILPLLRGLGGEVDGVVATRGGRLVGFLWGMVLPEFLGKRTVYSPEWANGAELAESRRIYEEMYRRLAARWVADGSFSHVLTLLAHDRQAAVGWHWLGFGMAAVDGVRGFQPVDGGAQVEIRRAGAADARQAAAFQQALADHLAATPVFWIHEPLNVEPWLRDARHSLWLAYQNGEAMGCMGLEPGYTQGCAIVQDEETVTISSAFTLERARNQGIATALLNRALAWAQAQGYARCATDFEAMNVPAARFWMRWFEPVCYSLMRWIDERVREA